MSYFHGAVRQARFTPKALAPDQFMKVVIASSGPAN
jgi:hypothetical protein